MIIFENLFKMNLEYLEQTKDMIINLAPIQSQERYKGNIFKQL